MTTTRRTFLASFAALFAGVPFIGKKKPRVFCDELNLLDDASIERGKILYNFSETLDPYPPRKDYVIDPNPLRYEFVNGVWVLVNPKTRSGAVNPAYKNAPYEA